MAEVRLVSSEFCAPCKELKRRLERLGVKFREIKVETKEGRELIKSYDLRAVPATIIRKEKKEIVLVGLPPEEELRRYL